MYDLAVGLVKYMWCQSLFIAAFINIHMNECNEIWALYEQTAAQPPQYQPTNNDKKASQLNAAAQKPQVAPQVNVQVMPQAVPQMVQQPTSQMNAQAAPSVVSQDEQQPQQEQEEHQPRINIARPQTKNVAPRSAISVRQKARQMGMLKDNFNNVIDSLQHQLLK